MNNYYIILLLAYVLKTLAGVPLLYQVYKTRDTFVVPYLTLIMMLTSGLLMLYTAISVRYYLHAFVYLIFFLVYGSILVFKYFGRNWKFGLCRGKSIRNSY